MSKCHGGSMKVRIIQAFVVIGVLPLLMIAFQNCGKAPSSQLDSLAAAEYSEKEVIVKMKSSSAQADMVRWAADNGLVSANTPSQQLDWDTANMSHWRWNGPATVNEFRGKLSQASINLDVEYAEPNYIYHEAANYTLSQVLSFSPALQTQTTVNISQNQLWGTLTPRKDKTIVAVVDSGLDINHSAFVDSSAIWTNPSPGPQNDLHGFNFIANNNDLTDTTGHGTHCAGIILGVGQNLIKTPLDTANIQIMPLKFIGANGGATSDAINAIFYAVKHGARVISNSWGGPSDSRALEDVIKYAYDNEVLFVAAAGNSLTNNDTTPTYPANYKLPNVISVAATDSSDRLASFSNYGSSVDLGAPGVSILSTYPGNVFAYLSGTSMATPFVAGTAALQYYERPSFTAAQVKSIILKKADAAAQLSGKIGNAVRLNANATVQETKVAAFQNLHPAYVTRNVASQSEENSKKAGCGMVAKAGGNFPPNPPWGVIAMLLLPIAVAFRFRYAEI